ncbi:Flp family type IVb pilin [Vibrio neonatus]|uniref:Flp family type IVb pilin n=1 Tax=Vibrio neonatus TaxID=278860 RepID=UPI0021C40D41|nr:Flp family type IVb pilin [Vibrio neonatus]
MFKTFLTRFIKDERGVTAIEYGLIAIAIAVVVGAAMTNVGDNVKTIFDAIAAAISTAAT